ncbi:glycosyltransferase [Limnohabitans sp.]|uniref:glycosyltransferase n=1 Tax=Limnohabitans sp. TaxID=1907725 RepID=UPI0031FCB100
MRIVIDMQGAQSSGSGHRGIGRYTLALAQAMVRNRGEHEVVLALSGLFPDSVEPIRAAFADLLPQSSIHVWHAPVPVNYLEPSNQGRRLDAENIYAAFLHELSPDVIHVTSLLEGFADDAVTSVRRRQGQALVAVTLYDLIPYLNPDPYLLNPSLKSWYLEKIEHLRRADLWLAISASSRAEGVQHLGFSSAQCHNISTDADAMFCPLALGPAREQALRQLYGLNAGFVMYTGGIDHRKNIEGLIRAFARLPSATRLTHQLAIICSVQPADRERLQRQAAAEGLAESELVLTGFVPDEDLLALYNLCSLFVFPSWHEGFGLPALEAMRCGAPAIGANCSSLPEVLGWSEALFDPKSDQDMARLMQRGLTDEAYRSELKQRQRHHAASFSWDESARRAIAAMHAAHLAKPNAAVHKGDECSAKRLRLAYVSPLPMARSGIADYSAELLPQLAKHYDIEVIVAQDEQVTDPWIVAHLPVRSAQWLLEHAEHFDRVLYHFGNSSYHQHMFDLIGQLPGVVVLHDFYLSGIQAHREVTGISPNAWVDALYASHGYQAVLERFTATDTADVVWRYPANLPVLQTALGVIVHSTHSADLARNWYGPDAAKAWSVIPLLRVPSTAGERAAARHRLGISTDDLLVCSFGVLGRTKLNHRLLGAWLRSPLSGNRRAHLVFVGQNEGGEYGQALLRTIKDSQARSRIHITGWADAVLFRDHLAAADLAVQLRTYSRGETSAAVLDCMNHGVPTIVNAHGSMADLDPDGVWLLPDEFTDEELAQALSALASDAHRREALGQKANAIIRTRHAPDLCAKQYVEAIEAAYAHQSSGMTGLLQDLSKSARADAELQDLSMALGRSFPVRPQLRQLLVDVSALVQDGAETDTQRVVRNLLQAWLAAPPLGFRVEPVYAQAGQGYRYARQFTTHFMGFSAATLRDDPIDFANGDVFLGLDLQPSVQTSNHDTYQAMRRQGVVVKFMVYDLLCIGTPEHFVPGAAEHFTRWLNVIAQTDGAVCISKAVADELAHWIRQNGAARQRPFSIAWSHLGADITEGRPSAPVSWDVPQGCLMVGTLEPRKGHAFVLDAFELLWQRGVNASLMIVGKQGWMVETLVERLRHHPDLNKRLFWFESISDEQLEAAYAKSACLIAASYGEGFGLPLIEAAQHKLPIIARDIPVFREVAGEHAFYFNSTNPEQLSLSLEQWLVLYALNKHPHSDNMPWLTWKQSAIQYLEALGIQNS